MFFKQSVFLGLTAGIASGLACMGYAKAYTEFAFVDFSSIAPPASLMAACIFGCTLAAIGYWTFFMVFKTKGELPFNLFFTALSFISIAGPVLADLPFGIKHPELFPGFAIPMHFFPALMWLTFKPLFFRKLN